MSKSGRDERVRIHPYVEAAIAERLLEYSAAAGIPASTVVQAALRQYLDRASDMTLVLRRLDRLGHAGERTQRDLELLSEAFAVWVKVWFAHAPRIDDDAKEFARRTAEARYLRFVEHVAEQFTGGQCFLDDLPREVLADEVELSNLAADPLAPASPGPSSASHGE